MWATISKWADALSLLSFGIAIYNAVMISKVRNTVIARARLPALTDVLEKQTQAVGDALARYNDDVEARRAMSSHLSKLNIILRRLLRASTKRIGQS